MEQPDIERLIGELEIAVDRLRSLYDQYFMGIEKLEPTVVRKDVDRRIHVLRKEQIRNTALRFRFQMLLQRYNTFQTHWQRICRDIENGTYKRHVIRAQQRFGAKKRGSGRPQPPSQPPQDPAGERTAADELAELDREFAPAETLDDKDVEFVEEPPTTRRGPPSSRVPRPPSSSRTPVALRQPPATPSPPRTPPPRTPSSKMSPPKTPPPKAGLPGGNPAPLPAPPPSRPGAAKPVASPPSGAKLVATPPRSEGRSGPPPSPRPAPPHAAQARPHHVRQTPRPVLPAARAPNDLSEERVRQLYSQYIEAKRRQNESTAAITYDAVARSLRESRAKLQQRHGRTVDFEVAIKDGHAIIRPVLK